MIRRHTPTASVSRQFKSPGRLLSTGKFTRRRMMGTEMIPWSVNENPAPTHWALALPPLRRRSLTRLLKCEENAVANVKYWEVAKC